MNRYGFSLYRNSSPDIKSHRNQKDGDENDENAVEEKAYENQEHISAQNAERYDS